MSSNNNLVMEKPQIILPKMVFEKINYFVQKGGSHEVSGLGVTEIIGNKIYVRDVMMAKQKNSGGSSDMEAEDVGNLLFKFHQKWPNLEANYWWHSHADMGVFWSGTDKSTIAQIGGAGMCVATVFNKKKETKSAVACMTPFPFFIDDIQTLVEKDPLPKELTDQWDSEYDANVVKKNTHSHQGSLYPGMSMESRYGYYGDSDYSQRMRDKELEDDLRKNWEKDDKGNWRRKSEREIKLGNANWDKAVPVNLPTKGAESSSVLTGHLFKDESGDKNHKHWEWAMNRDEVWDYDPLHQKFLLEDSRSVDADTYIKFVQESQVEIGAKPHGTI